MFSFEVNVSQTCRSIRRRWLWTRSCISNEAHRSYIDSISYVALRYIWCSARSFIESSRIAIWTPPYSTSIRWFPMTLKYWVRWGLSRINYELDQPTLRHCFRLRWASVESRIVFESNSSSDATVDSMCSSKLADRVVCDRDTDGWFVITVVLDDSELESNDFNLWILSRLFHCYKLTIWRVKIVHQRFASNFLGT